VTILEQSVKWIFGSGNRNSQRKPAPVQLCSLHIPNDSIRARTRTTALAIRWLFVWSTAWLQLRVIRPYGWNYRLFSDLLDTQFILIHAALPLLTTIPVDHIMKCRTIEQSWITDKPEKLITSTNKVTRIGELGTTLAITGNRSILRRNTSETSVITRTKSRNFPKMAFFIVTLNCFVVIGLSMITDISKTQCLTFIENTSMYGINF
jgi:hypothetical protein